MDEEYTREEAVFDYLSQWGLSWSDIHDLDLTDREDEWDLYKSDELSGVPGG